MLKETADVLLQEPVYKFSVTYPVKRMFKKTTETKDFEIKALNLHSMIKISREVLKINPEHMKGNVVDATYNILVESGEAVKKVVAYGIINGPEDPDSELLEIIGYMTAEDLKEAYMSILQQLNTTAFLSSIILIRNVNLMEMNPKDEGS